MKTTVTISVEEVAKGHMVKINHEGDQLPGDLLKSVTDGVEYYWRAVYDHERAKQSIPLMKQRRKAMKKRINDLEKYIDEIQGDGQLEKKPEPLDFSGDLPF